MKTATGLEKAPVGVTADLLHVTNAVYMVVSYLLISNGWFLRSCVPYVHVIGGDVRCARFVMVVKLLSGYAACVVESRCHMVSTSEHEGI